MQRVSSEDFLREIERELRGGEIRIYITSHPSADLDSIASAVALSYLLRSISENLSGDKICYLSIGGVDSLARRILEIASSRGILRECREISGEGVLFIVDAQSCERCGIDCSLFKRIFIIDHHITSEDMRSDNERFYYLLDPGSSSTTEIITRILLIRGILPRDQEILDIILSAILYDTNLLESVGVDTESIVREIMREGGSLHRSLKLLKRDLRYDEKIARIKALMRLKAFETREGIIICISRLRAHEGASAGLLMSAGCDISLIISERKEEIWVISRCGSLCDKKGIDEILLRDLVSRLGGSWGGHSKAAMARISISNLNTVESEILRILGEKLGSLKEIKS